MTKEEFIRTFNKGVPVKCDSFEQRRDVLLFLHEYGYTLNENGMRYIGDEPEANPEFMHPVRDYGRVCCRALIGHREGSIKFSDIEWFLYGENFELPNCTELLV